MCKCALRDIRRCDFAGGGETGQQKKMECQQSLEEQVISFLERRGCRGLPPAKAYCDQSAAQTFFAVKWS